MPLTDASTKVLLQNVAEIGESGRYSDLTILCKGNIYKKHQAYVCPWSKPLAASLNYDFKESQSNTIDLSDDDPVLIQRMLHYCYNLDYDGVLDEGEKGWNHENGLYTDEEAGEPPINGNVKGKEKNNEHVDAAGARSLTISEHATEDLPNREVLAEEETGEESPVEMVAVHEADNGVNSWAFSSSRTIQPRNWRDQRKRQKEKDKERERDMERERERIKERERERERERRLFSWGQIGSANEVKPAETLVTPDAPEQNPKIFIGPSVDSGILSTEKAPNKPVNHPSLLLNSRMYMLADKYDIPTLRSLALSKFTSRLSSHWNSEDFSLCVHDIYSNAAITNAPLRKSVVESAAKNIATLRDRDEFLALLKSDHDFVIDLLFMHVKIMEQRACVGAEGNVEWGRC
ncbi:MAG: hypothetical protein M1824_001802 [Vezdaea acicularis]|nr:MAG: hypothetical protein M1824_001802 [Vezdaea acicularis]